MRIPLLVFLHLSSDLHRHTPSAFDRTTSSESPKVTLIHGFRGHLRIKKRNPKYIHPPKIPKTQGTFHFHSKNRKPTVNSYALAAKLRVSKFSNFYRTNSSKKRTALEGTKKGVCHALVSPLQPLSRPFSILTEP
jgi:hypothetical protein